MSKACDYLVLYFDIDHRIPGDTQTLFEFYGGKRNYLSLIYACSYSAYLNFLNSVCKLPELPQ